MRHSDAGANVRAPIELNQAVETDAHAAVHAPWFSVFFCGAEAALTGAEHDGRKRFAGISKDRLAVYTDLEPVTALNALINSQNNFYPGFLFLIFQ